MIDYLIPWIAPAAAAVIVILIIACGYVKAPPDQAYIISGPHPARRDALCPSPLVH